MYVRMYIMYSFFSDFGFVSLPACMYVSVDMCQYVYMHARVTVML